MDGIFIMPVRKQNLRGQITHHNHIATVWNCQDFWFKSFSPWVAFLRAATLLYTSFHVICRALHNVTNISQNECISGSSCMIWGLRIWHCCSGGESRSCGSDSIPDRGTSYASGADIKIDFFLSVPEWIRVLRTTWEVREQWLGAQDGHLDDRALGELCRPGGWPHFKYNVRAGGSLQPPWRC